MSAIGSLEKTRSGFGSWLRPRWAGWLLAAAVLLTGLGVTYAIWSHSLALSRAEARYEFEVAAAKIVSSITENIDGHLQALWGVAALFASNPEMTREQWEAYVSALKLDQRLPGTRGLTYAALVPASERDEHIKAIRARGYKNYQIWPQGPRDSYLVVTFLAPLADRTYNALGFDLLSDDARRAAVELARDSGQPVLTAKIALLTRNPSPKERPGFLLYVPAYRHGAPLNTVAERRSAFIGVASSPFRANDFILNPTVVREVKQAGLTMEIYDGAGTGAHNLLFRSDNFPDAKALERDPHFVTTIAEHVNNRTWTFKFARSPKMSQQGDWQMPDLILVSGILISLLTSLVVGTLWLNRAQAIEANRRLRADVARREQTEEKLRQSEARFHLLFDRIPLPAFAVDRETLRYFAVNKAAVERYGYSHDEFSQMQITDIRPREDIDAWRQYLDGVRNRHSYSSQLRHRLRDGTIIDVEILAHSFALEGHHLTIEVANDITERLQAERALAKSEQQLRQAQKLEAIGQLTGGIAHDFNNILTVITGTIEVLADGVAHDAKLSTIARLIDEAAMRGSDLTRSLLAFARRQPLQPQDVDVNDLVVSASRLFRATIGQQIEVESVLEPDLWRAFVDPSLLTTSMLNLALNARDAMPNGGRLQVETSNVVLDDDYVRMIKDVRPGPYVMVSVSDNGVGIPDSLRDKVFEPFFTTKEVGKGTGLGLSMVYGFVKQSGGHIHICSKEGRGTTVRLYLPRASIPLSPDAVTLLPPMVEGGQETILVVEDDALVRDYVTEQLNRLGYVTLVAANASEALAIADKGVEVDLLFTDVMMPGPMDGRQLARALRERRPGLRVLFTSGHSPQAASRECQLDPSVNLLSKPYRTVDLAAKVRQVLDSPPPEDRSATTQEQGAVQ